MLRDKENIAPKVSTMKTAATAESPATRNLSQRLESLPFTRKHTRLLGVTGIGWALDAMDVGLISFIMAALTKQWSLSPPRHRRTVWRADFHTAGFCSFPTLSRSSRLQIQQCVETRCSRVSKSLHLCAKRDGTKPPP